jgi:hypothetical protein
VGDSERNPLQVNSKPVGQGLAHSRNNMRKI